MRSWIGQIISCETVSATGKEIQIATTVIGIGNQYTYPRKVMVVDLQDSESQAAEIDRLKAELELRTRLTTAVYALLNKRNNTEWTYEEAYEFTFKGYGRREWNEVIEASGWIQAPI